MVYDRAAILPTTYVVEVGVCGRIDQTSVKEAVDVLRERYHCKDWSDEQVFELVDAAVLNLANGIRPKDSREASLTAPQGKPLGVPLMG